MKTKDIKEERDRSIVYYWHTQITMIGRVQEQLLGFGIEIQINFDVNI